MSSIGLYTYKMLKCGLPHKIKNYGVKCGYYRNLGIYIM